MLKITDFGAVGDGITMNTEMIRAAIAAAAERQEAVCIPDGVFLTGSIDLQGVSLYLEPAAVLKASGDLADYTPLPYVHNEMGQVRAMIGCLNSEHVSITGSGTVDLSGSAFYDMNTMNIPDTLIPMTPEQAAECTHPIGKRPEQGIFFHNCRDVRIQGVNVIDSPNWTISMSECRDIILQGLRIDTDLNIPNNDGIHLSACEGAVISDCHISSGDDCIAMSCITNWRKPCENIVVTNCVLRSCSKAIVLGYVYSVVRNVMISNCIIRQSNRGLAIMCHDECARVENVTVSHCVIETRVRAGNWWGNGEPVLMMAVPHDRLLPEAQRMTAPKGTAICNITLSHVTCIGENALGIIGSNGNICGITLDGVNIRRVPSRNLPLKGNTFDLSPALFRPDVPQECGLFIRDAGVMLKDVEAGDLKIIIEK